MNRETLTSAQEWRRYWPLVVAASVGFSFTSIMQVYTGLFMGPVTEEFGWTKTQLTSGLSLSMVLTTVLSPFLAC